MLRAVKYLSRACSPKLSGTFQIRRRFTVLAFESSADDTCVAVVNSKKEILSNVVIKQNEDLVKFGGIQPAAAVLAHQRNMPVALQRALSEAGITLQNVDGIAFTRGPGISICLGVCCVAAKSLAAGLNKPLVGVHHMQAHALTPILTASPSSPVEFPFLTLLVSGGHTMLVLAESMSRFRILATALDESIGRTFDKISRKLELDWTALGPGAALEAFCRESDDDQVPEGFIPFPRPMPTQLAFSYSSLHSHLDRYLSGIGSGIASLSVPNKRAIARSFQQSAILQLEDKLRLALDWCEKKQITVRNLVVSGGVASNAYLRERLDALLSSRESQSPIVASFPPPSLCTDNAAMIGWAAMHRFLSDDHDSYEIGPLSKWSMEELDARQAA